MSARKFRAVPIQQNQHKARLPEKKVTIFINAKRHGLLHLRKRSDVVDLLAILEGQPGLSVSGLISFALSLASPSKQPPLVRILTFRVGRLGYKAKDVFENQHARTLFFLECRCYVESTSQAFQVRAPLL